MRTLRNSAFFLLCTLLTVIGLLEERTAAAGCEMDDGCGYDTAYVGGDPQNVAQATCDQAEQELSCYTYCLEDCGFWQGGGDEHFTGQLYDEGGGSWGCGISCSCGCQSPDNRG